MIQPYSIRVHGQPRGVHSQAVSSGEMGKGYAKVAANAYERHGDGNGPVTVLVRDGVRLTTPEVVEVRE